MTPEDLLAACRAAWPDGASAWALYRTHATHPQQCIRALPTAYLRCEVELTDRTPAGKRREAAACLGRMTDADEYWSHTDTYEATATLEGVREVVSRLRDWCREEAGRLAEEVDPPPPQCGATCAHGRCLMSAGHEGATMHVAGAGDDTVYWGADGVCQDFRGRPLAPRGGV